MQDRIFDLLVNQDDVTWKDIIYDLVRKEGLNPWDIDVSLLTKKYIQRVRELKESNLKLSGKVLFAAAFLLKIKANRLVDEDIDTLDAMISQNQMSEEQFYEDLENQMRSPNQISDEERAELIPRTPLPRERKVSIYDLVNALEKALEVKKRRLIKKVPNFNVVMPFKKYDITLSIKRIYKNILDFFHEKKCQFLTFTQLAPKGTSKDQVISTFLPLLHLSNDHKINLEQDEPFGEIRIKVIDPAKVKMK